MPFKCELRGGIRLRFCLSSMVSLGLAGLILWGLVSIYDPEAKLLKVNLQRNGTEDNSTIHLELEVTNRNYFRGFNYTGGWVELFYVSDSDDWELTWDYIPSEYQGFRKTLSWNISINISTYKLNWTTYSPLLKSQESHVYVSLYMEYWYKILFWVTHTTNYQWLDTNVYFNDRFDLEEATLFRRMKNFTLGIST